MNGVWVFGATGYSGQELCRWMDRHPAPLLGVSGHSTAGTALRQWVPEAPERMKVQHHRDLLSQATAQDAAFLATPAETSVRLAEPLLAKGVSVIDLSGGFRLAADQYPEWYGFEHPTPNLLKRAHLGLTEWLPPPPVEEGSPRLVANPGCYATAAALALAPAVRAGLVEGPLFLDGKSGTTGAGRKAAEHLLFSEVAENLGPYRVGRHQHTPEIERLLAAVSDRPWQVQFVPHLVPQRRGLLVTAYGSVAEGVTPEAVEQAYASAYRETVLVEVQDVDQVSTGRHCQRPTAGVGARMDPRTGSLVAFGAIDNLAKGAATQAIQNLNRLWGLPATTGLWKNGR